MNNFVDQLLGEFTGNTTKGISQHIGANEVQTQNALNQFLPIMAQALTRNSQTPQGASSLMGALTNDHDGGILSNVMGFLGNANSGPGKGILGHVFSSQLGGVNNFISESTGLSPQMTSTLMEVAAPLVMGYLGKSKNSQNMDQNGLTSWLTNSTQEVQKTDPKNMGMIASLLDSNNDGNVMDDVASMGMNLLGSWLSGRG